MTNCQDCSYPFTNEAQSAVIRGLEKRIQKLALCVEAAYYEGYGDCDSTDIFGDADGWEKSDAKKELALIG